MYISATVSTILAWFIGLVIDASIDFQPVGFLCLRVLFPVLVMGRLILKSINRNNKA